MQSYTLKLIKKEDIAERTQAFRLEKPAGFEFKPGQYQEVYLSEDPNDSHTFSIASSPHEDFLMFASRMRKGSAFKQRLASLKEGDMVRIEAPAGNFVLPKEADLPVTLLVGGIGVTPVRSMVKWEEYNGSMRPITLFYSNRKPEEAAFLHELETITLPQYRLVATMTDVEHSAQEWSGETGYIDRPMLEKYLTNLAKPVFYVVGPPTFVEAMTTLLSSIDDVPSTHVKSEDFAGY